MRAKIMLPMFIMMASAVVLLSNVYAADIMEMPAANEEEITGQVIDINYDTSMILLTNPGRIIFTCCKKRQSKRKVKKSNSKICLSVKN